MDISQMNGAHPVSEPGCRPRAPSSILASSCAPGRRRRPSERLGVKLMWIRHNVRALALPSDGTFRLCRPEERRASAASPRPPALQHEIKCAYAGKALRDVGPVHELPERFHPIALDVLVLQVVGVLPHVQHEQRNGAITDVALVVIDLLDDEPAPERLPADSTPAGALDVHRGLCKLAFEAGEGAEELLHGRSQLSVRLPATARA